MKYSIFFYEGELTSEEFRQSLTLSAVSAYCAEHNIDFDEAETVISKGEKGKPYIAGLPVHFNVSHTGSMWMCMAGPEPCGVDIQLLKECDYEKIAGRHFSREISHHLKGSFRSVLFQLLCEMIGKVEQQSGTSAFPSDDCGALFASAEAVVAIVLINGVKHRRQNTAAKRRFAVGSDVLTESLRKVIPQTGMRQTKLGLGCGVGPRIKRPHAVDQREPIGVCCKK
jgi:hypothetical protein